ncbi:MAG: response regulator [Candidatus Sericytochromatia bacterium]|nr:response regulator [Candidatus Sericytochromatia bacterium]
MTNTDKGTNPMPDSSLQLRKLAEELYLKKKSQNPTDLEGMEVDDIQHLVHELLVHQIELEMQNDELHRTQLELDAARSRYYELYNLAPVGYLSVSQKGLILEANLSASALLNLSQLELLKQPIFRFILPEDQDVFYHHRKNILSTGQAQTCELRLRHLTEGQPTWLYLNGSLLSSNRHGDPIFLLILSDISELKQLETERQARQKAEFASQAKSRFLAHMSHEIRTPLNAILGFSELMQQQLHEPRWQNYLQAINSSGKTLLHIIDDILDLSKIEAGKIEIKPTAIDLRQLVQELDLLLRKSFAEKGLKFEVQTDPDLPISLSLDPLRLRQILINLLNNALKFTTKGSVILRISYLATSAESGQLSLSVSDTGVGISDHFKSRIFQPFEQEPSSEQTSTGTGLGLAITYQLVELMQGQILLESQLGVGTSFQILLSDIRQSSLSSSTEARSDTLFLNFAPACLLLVDDQPTNLQLLQAYLEEQPFQILLAHNGQEACEQALQSQPDLILMDIRMPVMDGTEALRQLKSNPLTASIPVIALTAYSLQQEKNSFLEMGFDGYLRKPVSKVELWACLQAILKLQRPDTEPLNDFLCQETALKKDLILILKQECLPRWEVLQQSMVVNELENFASELLLLAERYTEPRLKNFAFVLLNDIQQFALESAQQHLLTFPLFLQKE